MTTRNFDSDDPYGYMSDGREEEREREPDPEPGQELTEGDDDDHPEAEADDSPADERESGEGEKPDRERRRRKAKPRLNLGAELAKLAPGDGGQARKPNAATPTREEPEDDAAWAPMGDYDLATFGGFEDPRDQAAVDSVPAAASDLLGLGDAIDSLGPQARVLERDANVLEGKALNLDDPEAEEAERLRRVAEERERRRATTTPPVGFAPVSPYGRNFGRGRRILDDEEPGGRRPQRTITLTGKTG